MLCFQLHRSADEALLATLPPAIMAEAQALQARMARHAQRAQAVNEAMQASLGAGRIAVAG